MNGLLVYDSDGAKRNEWFINELIAGAQSRGVKLSLAIAQNGRLDCNGDNCEFAIVRTILPSINYSLEAQMRVFNNYRTSLTANDKWRTHLLCTSLGIPTMHTISGDANSAAPPFLPCVVKSVDGHGGSEVFFAQSPEQYITAVQTILSRGKRFIVQQPCSEPGKDMRAYVLGGDVIACALRQSDCDFRSNYSLGGKAALAHPDDEQLRIISQIVNALGCDYVGVDFIRHDGKWILNEIEDVVGARMLYELTKINIADRYIEHIIFTLSRG